MSPSPQPPTENETTYEDHAMTTGDGNDGNDGDDRDKEMQPASSASSTTADAATEPSIEDSCHTSNKRSAPAARPSSPPENADESAAAGADAPTAKLCEGKQGAEVDDTQPDVDGAVVETPAAKRRALCGVCSAAPAKYKCPRCSLSYCSVTCSRVHRDNHPPDESKPEEPAAPAADLATTASSAHPFSILDDAPELRLLFSKYPTLPAQLRTIYEATLPPAAHGAPAPFPNSQRGGAQRGGRSGGRGGGRGSGRGGGRGNGFSAPFSRPWTAEVGLVQGQKALRRARVDPGEGGDGVRAYCETVTYLLAKRDHASRDDETGTAQPHRSADDVRALVRDGLASESNQMIQRLLDAEGRQ